MCIMKMIIISHFQAEKIMEAYDFGRKRVNASLNLEMTTSNVKIDKNEVIFPEGDVAEIIDIKKICRDDSNCYVFQEGMFIKAAVFSETTQLYYKLYPTKTAPTIEISGIRMHRVKEVEPWEDAKAKINTISPVKGRVLDTCCGLGYTAIISSQHAEKVFTFEKDENVTTLARMNPWSQKLFSTPNIKFAQEDILNAIDTFDPYFFDIIIHDPPSFLVAGELYSKEFYNKLHDKLKNGGKIFHYTGAPGLKFRGLDLMSSVDKRLKEVGFKNIQKDKKTFGIIAEK